MLRLVVPGRAPPRMSDRAPMVDPAGSVLEAADIRVAFGERCVLAGASLKVSASELVAVRGRSGSGKSTLLRVLAGVQVPDSGRVLYGERELTSLSDDARSRLRLSDFGFIFQFADLVPELTLRENIELPLEFLGFGRKARKARVDPLVEGVGLQDCCDRLPHAVSGGERQRAAVARALVHRPRVVFADEPTGSLDSASRDTVLELLSVVSVRFASALVVVTHDAQVTQICDRAVELADGVVAG